MMLVGFSRISFCRTKYFRTKIFFLLIVIFIKLKRVEQKNVFGLSLILLFLDLSGSDSGIPSKAWIVQTEDRGSLDRISLDRIS
jgi:hypothetical protein